MNEDLQGELSEDELTVTWWYPDGTVSSGAVATQEDALVWVDISAASNALGRAAALLAQLEPLCPGLTLEVLTDLLVPDSIPGTEDYEGSTGTTLRKVSTFSIESRSLQPAADRDDFERPGLIVLEPTELVSGEGWLLSCWHARTVYSGIDICGDEPSSGPHGTLRAVRGRWASHTGTPNRSAADLGLLAVEELALTYVPTMRKLREWLEAWEISLFVGRRTERQPVAQLWGSIALLRRWLTPLNPAGLRKDINKAWLIPATDAELCHSIDDRIDRALEAGGKLSDTLRSSLPMLHSEIEQQARKTHERGQRVVEVLAAVFLIPTLIVGFFGANTWLPGQHSTADSMHAFDFMLATMGVLTFAAVVVLWMWRGAQRRSDRQVEEELAEMRRILGFRNLG
ncbi:CorA family divalent cation transporter [Nocardioides montaniterrae]